jgi:Mrp family chromosome partitioning ATPase
MDGLRSAYETIERRVEFPLRGTAQPLSERPAPSFQTVPFKPPVNLDMVEFTALYHTLDNAVGSPACASIQFVATDAGDGAEQVARDLAWVAATLLDKRVLLLSDARDVPGFSPLAGTESQTREPKSFQIDQEIGKVSGHSLCIGQLRHEHAGPHAAAERLTTLFEATQDLFDLILVVAPPAATDPFAICMGQFVGGTVIVVRAQHTRLPAIALLRTRLEGARTALIGMVLTDVRPSLPRWLKRWI